jgi:threonine synthase
MQLYSTNNKHNIVGLKESVLNAFPQDKGLYMPTEIPKLDKQFLDHLEQYSFEEIGFQVAARLMGNAIPESELYQLIARAINFKAPLVQLTEQISTLELWHGPTMAFKDFGARFMAELMSYFLRDEDRPTTILVATSGDTGGAVAAGFHKVPGIEVIILYPSGKVSALQEKQLTTWGDNISAIEIDGVFDDCQRLVKTAFIDADLQQQYNFSSANSINIARLIPQSFYYFEGYKQVKDKSRPVAISVPSGNFGNLTAGLLAAQMGLPIHQFIAATNANDTVPAYLTSGTYTAKPSVPTISNAMDVGNPSNFPRMQALFAGQDESSTWNKLKEFISGDSYTDTETLQAIKDIHDKYDYEADPHGAVGYLACQDYLKKYPNHQTIFLETAHPGKFEAPMKEALGKVSFPPKLEAFMSGEKVAKSCSKNYADFKEILLS